MLFTVALYGSDPDALDNDDCWESKDFYDEDEALDYFENLFDDPKFVDSSTSQVKYCTAFIVLESPLGDKKRSNPHFVPDDPNEWQRESARQAGMMGGTQSFNDVMGY